MEELKLYTLARTNKDNMMHKIIIISLMSISIFFYQGCSSFDKKEIMKKEINYDLNKSRNLQSKKKAIEIVEVSAENFNLLKETIPDTEILNRVKIMGAKLDDVVSLLTEATGQDIIFQLQSESQGRNLGARSISSSSSDTGVGSGRTGIGGVEYLRNSKVYVAASDIGFGRLLKKAVGDQVSIRYEDETYYLGADKTVTLKIPSLGGLPAAITKTLLTLGATSIAHDRITSSVTFSAREKEYQDIMKYLTILRNNLYVIEYEISIYDVELKDNYSLGINWSLMPALEKAIGFASQTSAVYGTVAATTQAAQFGMVLDTDNFSGSIMGEALTHFGKVESLQKPKLLGIAGTDVVLIDGLEEPYIESLQAVAVGEQGVQTSTTSATALSGLKITLNSNIMDGTVITDIAIDINDIVGYTNFTIDGNTYTQPRTRTKNITNSMRVQPGVPIVISGLFRNKVDMGYKGIPGLAQTGAKLIGGSEYDGNVKSEMVIIVTPRVIKYVMK